MKKYILILLTVLAGSYLYANGEDDPIAIRCILDKNSEENRLVHFIPKRCVDVLYSRKRDTIKRYYPDIEKLRYFDEAKDDFVEWYEQECFRNLFIKRNAIDGYDILNIGSDDYGASLGLFFYITNYEQKDNVWYLTCKDGFHNKYLKNSNCFTKWPEEKEECVIILKIDGDYIHIYINSLNNYYDTYCLVYTSFLEQYKRLIKEDSCYVNQVLWPRHADGSCDYENRFTSASVNKIKTVKENLKLRSDPHSSVLCTMAAGTKVKIVEVGQEESIDGFVSNWVKVEVQKGAKDRNGNEIKAGTFGWCFGGYLR